MKYRTRTYYTDTQKALMWERWKAGWIRLIQTAATIKSTSYGALQLRHRMTWEELICSLPNLLIPVPAPCPSNFSRSGGCFTRW